MWSPEGKVGPGGSGCQKGAKGQECATVRDVGEIQKVWEVQNDLFMLSKYGIWTKIRWVPTLVILKNVNGEVSKDVKEKLNLIVGS